VRALHEELDRREAQRLTGPWRIGAEAVMYTHEKDVVATRILEDEEKNEDLPTYARGLKGGRFMQNRLTCKLRYVDCYLSV
jgi:hypothetical protein